MSTMDLARIIAATKALTEEAISHGRRDILVEMRDIITTAGDSLDKTDHKDDGSEDGEIIERRGALSAASIQVIQVKEKVMISSLLTNHKRPSEVTGANAVPVTPRKPGRERTNTGSSTKPPPPPPPVRNPIQERYEHSIRKEHRNQQERRHQSRSEHHHDPPQQQVQQPEQRPIQLPERQRDKHKIFQASIPCAVAEIAEPTAVKTLTAQTVGHDGGFTLLAEKVAPLKQPEQTTKKWIVVFEKAPQIGDVTFSIDIGLGGEGDGVFLALFAPAVKVEGNGQGCAVCANRGHGCARCPFVDEVTAGDGEH